VDITVATAPVAGRLTVEPGSGAAMETPFWAEATGRALHSSTLQLNLSAFFVTGGAVRGCFGGVLGGRGGVLRAFGVCIVSETAQVELISGRV
jgi:hypothetical protein